MANVKISQLPLDTSLSDDAYLLGIDSGATVRIPASAFQQNLNDEYLPYKRVDWDNPSTTMLSSVTAVVPRNSSEKTVVQIHGYSSALLLCQVSNANDSTCRVRATNLYTGEVLDSGQIDPTTVTLSDFLSGEDTSPLAERVNNLDDRIIYGRKVYVEDAKTFLLSDIAALIVADGYLGKGPIELIQFSGDRNGLWLFGMNTTTSTPTNSFYHVSAVDLEYGSRYSVQTDTTKMTLYEFEDYVVKEQATTDYVEDKISETLGTILATLNRI